MFVVSKPDQVLCWQTLTWQLDNFKEPGEEHGPLLPGVVDHLCLHCVCLLSRTQIWPLVWFRKNKQKHETGSRPLWSFSFPSSSVHAAPFDPCCDWPQRERCWPFGPIWPLTWTPAETCWCIPEQLPSRVLDCFLSRAGCINALQQAEHNRPPVEVLNGKKTTWNVVKEKRSL